LAERIRNMPGKNASIMLTDSKAGLGPCSLTTLSTAFIR
jgi:hypothetical protein